VPWVAGDHRNILSRISGIIACKHMPDHKAPLHCNSSCAALPVRAVIYRCVKPRSAGSELADTGSFLFLLCLCEACASFKPMDARAERLSTFCFLLFLIL
jgi:hypothetical protein